MLAIEAAAAALKVAVVAPAVTVADAGTVSEALLLPSVTLDPLAGAAAMVMERVARPSPDETGAELNCSATANLAIAEASAVALAAGAVAAASAPVEAALAFGLAGVGLATKTGCVTTALPSSGAFPNGSQNARPRMVS